MISSINSTKKRHQLDESIVYFKGKRLKIHKINPSFLEKKLNRVSTIQKNRFENAQKMSERLIRDLNAPLSVVDLHKGIILKRISKTKQSLLLKRLKRFSIWVDNVMSQEEYFSKLPADSKLYITSKDRKHALRNSYQSMVSYLHILEIVGVVDKGYTNEWCSFVKSGKKVI